MIKQSPDLLKCSQSSLIISLLRAAAVGLPPDGILQMAYLIPREIKRQVRGQWTKVWEAGFQIGYQGWAELARRSGEVTYIAARVVRERDRYQPPVFTLHKDDFEHEPYMGDEDAGKIKSAYGVVRFRNGEANSLHLTLARIYSDHRRFSTAYNPDNSKCPWVAHEEAMIQKTLITAICKHAPKSAELRAAATLDERQDKGIEIGDEAAIRRRLIEGAGGPSVTVLDVASFTGGTVVESGEKDDAPQGPAADEPQAGGQEPPADTPAAVNKPEERPRPRAVEKPKPAEKADVPPEDRDISDLFAPTE
jgi:recombination protein RecT